MTAGDALESRISIVERDQARQDERMSGLERRVDSLTPLLTSVVTLTIEFKNLREDLTRFIERVDRRDEQTTANRVIEKKDRIAQRRWVIGIGVVLLAALIGAVAVIVSAG